MIDSALIQVVFEIYVGYGIRFWMPSINGRPISAKKDSFLSIVGTRVEQKDGTLYTVQGTDTLLLRGVIHPNCYRPEHMKTDGSHLFPDGVSYIARRKDLSTFTS